MGPRSGEAACRCIYTRARRGAHCVMLCIQGRRVSVCAPSLCCLGAIYILPRPRRRGDVHCVVGRGASGVRAGVCAGRGGGRPRRGCHGTNTQRVFTIHGNSVRAAPPSPVASGNDRSRVTRRHTVGAGFRSAYCRQFLAAKPCCCACAMATVDLGPSPLSRGRCCYPCPSVRRRPCGHTRGR